MASLCIDNLIAALNGGEVLTAVNPQVLTQVSAPV
jgi:gluconate 2-dehydrogenase